MKALRTLMLYLSGIFIVIGGSVQAQDGYKIRAGDVLRIEVLEDPGLNRSVLVAPDGRFSLPFAGVIKASGRAVESIQADLSKRLAANFAAPPNVFVAVERLAERTPRVAGPAPTISIYVVGEAAKPGKIDVEPGTNLLQFIGQMGGFSKFAATKRIQLRRGGSTYGINYPAIEQGTVTTGSMALKDGDVLVIPQRRLFE